MAEYINFEEKKKRCKKCIYARINVLALFQLSKNLLKTFMRNGETKHGRYFEEGRFYKFINVRVYKEEQE